MFSKTYLNKLLALCSKEQLAIFSKIYPEGPNPGQLKQAVLQIESTLRKVHSTRGQLDAANSTIDCQKTLIVSLERTLQETNDSLKAATEKIDRLSTPINLANEGIQERLNLLDALEAAGVDNWVGYSDALSEEF